MVLQRTVLSCQADKNYPVLLSKKKNEKQPEAQGHSGADNTCGLLSSVLLESQMERRVCRKNFEEIMVEIW